MKRRIEKVLRILFWYPILALFYRLAKVFPRNNNIWVFGSTTGFVDNPRYIFEYLSAQYSGPKYIWLSRCRQEISQIRQAGYTAHLISSPLGIWYAFRAGIGLVTTSFMDLNSAAVGGMKVIQLWHGTPLKLMRNDSKFLHYWKGYVFEGLFYWVRSRIFPWVGTNFTLVITASQKSTKRLASAFDLPMNRFFMAGSARDDIILGPCPRRSEWKESFGLKEEQKFILYVPTFRGIDGGGLTWLESFDPIKWDDLLQELDAHLFIRLHSYDRELLLEKSSVIENSTRIHQLSWDMAPDINRLYPLVDLAITDYSSLIYDYAQLGKPLILFAPDLEKYSSERGFYEPYESLSNGRHIQTAPALLTAVKRALVDWCPEDQTWVDNIAAEFNLYQDTENCSRIIHGIFDRFPEFRPDPD